MAKNVGALPAEFPGFVLGPGFGQWWEVHSEKYGPWYFASDDGTRAASNVGRFDLAMPNGTLYLGDHLSAVTPEAVREPDVGAAESQRAYNDRRLSAMPLDRFYGARIARLYVWCRFVLRRARRCGFSSSR